MIEQHEYNHPGLSPLQFMLAVVNDPTVDIRDRLKAAEYAAPYLYAVPKQIRDLRPTVKVTIPYMPDLWFASFTPEMQNDLLYIKDCYDRGLNPFEVKGHA